MFCYALSFAAVMILQTESFSLLFIVYMFIYRHANFSIFAFNHSTSIHVVTRGSTLVSCHDGPLGPKPWQLISTDGRMMHSENDIKYMVSLCEILLLAGKCQGSHIGKRRPQWSL